MLSGITIPHDRGYLGRCARLASAGARVAVLARSRPSSPSIDLPVRVQPDIIAPGSGIRAAACGILAARAGAALRRDLWNVGLAKWTGMPSLGGTVTLEPNWLPDPPPGHFLADPFPLAVDHGTQALTLLAEDYEYATRTGRLVSLDWDTGPQTCRSAFETPYHSSYPFILTTAEGTFCIPECLRSGEVAAWQLRDDGNWTKAFVLITGRRLVDPTVFQRGSTWWLFATDEDRSAGTNLYLWYADRLPGPWKEHPLNPVLSDVRSSRPAGPLFVEGSRLIRPGQDCSETYGGKIALNEVTLLDRSSYRERQVGTVRIKAGSAYPGGPHTLAFVTPHLVLLDGKRSEFIDFGLVLRDAPRRVRSLTRRIVRVASPSLDPSR